MTRGRLTHICDVRSTTNPEEITLQTSPRISVRALRMAASALLLAVFGIVWAAPAATAAPVLSLSPQTAMRVEPGDTFTYRLPVHNVSDEDSSGPISIDVALPPGITGVSVAGIAGAPFTWVCSDPAGASTLHCASAFPFPVAAHRVHPEVLTLTAALDPGATGTLTTSIELSGGGTAQPLNMTTHTNASSVTDFGVAAFDGGTFDRDGGASTGAGTHPETGSATFRLNTYNDADALGGPYIVSDGGDLRNVRVSLPPGLIGNPTAVPRCEQRLSMPSAAQAISAFDPSNFCPLNSIVGTVAVTSTHVRGHVQRYVAPVFNLEPPPGVPARFGFKVLEFTTMLDAELRNDGDYGVDVVTRYASQSRPVLGSTVTLWGTPADPIHDSRRCMIFINAQSIPSVQDPKLFPDDGPLPTCQDDSGRPWLLPNAAGVPQKALLTNPTACTPAGVGLETTLRIDSWRPPHPTGAASFVSHLTPGYPLPLDEWGSAQGPTDCDRLPFDPSMEVRPDTSTPDAPSGLAFDLSFPTDGLTNPDGLSQAHLKRAAVMLPEGVSVSPSAAGGLAACTDEQSGIGTRRAAACPDASKVGTVEAATPLLEEKLTGGVYIGSQKSDDPASGEMFRLFLTLDNDERGVHVKLPGQVRVDPDTGRIETVFDNNPQVPIERISLRLKSGPRAPLAMPQDCGTKSIDATFASWGGQTVGRSASFTVDCPGAIGFSPSFEAGSLSPTGGDFSPFVARIDRPDRQRFLSGVRVDMPKGLVAKLAGVPLCGSFQAANGDCPVGSQIGTATVGAGPGASPFYLQGPVYLTTGYKGGPYGLSVQVPVKAGPFDLGTVIVRQAIHVDPETAQLSVVSDPLPQIVKGVPVRLRSAVVDVDRERFAINPTSCAEKQVRAALTSIDGQVHRAATRFQASDCASLGFKPRLSMRLTGKRQRRTGGHPGLKTTLRQAAGQANLDRLRVALPKTLALDPANANGLCSYEEGQKPDSRCPASSVIGSAVARTPLLNQPLRGKVYFLENKRRTRQGNLVRTLPTLLVALRGEVAINVRLASSVSNGRLVSTAAGIPDARVSRFDLNLKGGNGGIITVTRSRARRFDICQGRQTAAVQSDAQNGRRADYSVAMKTPCAGRKNALRGA